MAVVRLPLLRRHDDIRCRHSGSLIIRAQQERHFGQVKIIAQQMVVWPSEVSRPVQTLRVTE